MQRHGPLAGCQMRWVFRNKEQERKRIFEAKWIMYYPTAGGITPKNTGF